MIKKRKEKLNFEQSLRNLETGRIIDASCTGTYVRPEESFFFARGVRANGANSTKRSRVRHFPWLKMFYYVARYALTAEEVAQGDVKFCCPPTFFASSASFSLDSQPADRLESNRVLFVCPPFSSLVERLGRGLQTLL